MGNFEVELLVFVEGSSIVVVFLADGGANGCELFAEGGEGLELCLALSICAEEFPFGGELLVELAVGVAFLVELIEARRYLLLEEAEQLSGFADGLILDGCELVWGCRGPCAAVRSRPASGIVH